MLPSDNHVHSEWSWDTPATPTMLQTCRRAVETGLPAVAFTEHVDFTGWDPDQGPPDARRDGWLRRRIHPLDVEGYQESLEKCRAMFPSLRIRSGIEAGEPHRFDREVRAVLRSGDFERVLGSLHSIVEDDRLIFADHLFDTCPAADVMRRYFSEMLDLINGSDVFQVLAHCDYPRRYWRRTGGPDYREADYESEYRAVFRLLAGSGRALEINTNSPLWSASLMRWWYQEGGEAVSFGSDAHESPRVGDKFALAVDVVEAAGFRPGRDRFDFWRR